MKDISPFYLGHKNRKMSAMASDSGSRKTLTANLKSFDMNRLAIMMRKKINYVELTDFFREYINTYAGTTDMLILFFLEKFGPYIWDNPPGPNKLVDYMILEWDPDMLKLFAPCIIVKIMRDADLSVLENWFQYNVIDIWYATRHIKNKISLHPENGSALLEVLEHGGIRSIDNLDLDTQDPESVGDLMNELALLNMRSSFLHLSSKGFKPSVYLVKIGHRLNPDEDKVLLRGKYSSQIISEYLSLNERNVNR